MGLLRDYIQRHHEEKMLAERAKTATKQYLAQEWLAGNVPDDIGAPALSDITGMPVDYKKKADEDASQVEGDLHIVQQGLQGKVTPDIWQPAFDRLNKHPAFKDHKDAMQGAMAKLTAPKIPPAPTPGPTAPGQVAGTGTAPQAPAAQPPTSPVQPGSSNFLGDLNPRQFQVFQGLSPRGQTEYFNKTQQAPAPPTDLPSPRNPPTLSIEEQMARAQKRTEDINQLAAAGKISLEDANKAQPTLPPFKPVEDTETPAAPTAPQPIAPVTPQADAPTPSVQDAAQALYKKWHPPGVFQNPREFNSAQTGFTKELEQLAKLQEVKDLAAERLRQTREILGPETPEERNSGVIPFRKRSELAAIGVPLPMYGMASLMSPMSGGLTPGSAITATEDVEGNPIVKDDSTMYRPLLDKVTRKPVGYVLQGTPTTTGYNAEGQGTRVGKYGKPGEATGTVAPQQLANIKGPTESGHVAVTNLADIKRGVAPKETKIVAPQTMATERTTSSQILPDGRTVSASSLRKVLPGNYATPSAAPAPAQTGGAPLPVMDKDRLKTVVDTLMIPNQSESQKNNVMKVLVGPDRSPFADAVRQELAKRMADDPGTFSWDGSQAALSQRSVQTLGHIKTILATVDKLDKAGQLGPVMSRWNEFWTNHIGSDLTQNADYNSLANNLDLLTKAMGFIHGGSRGGGSIQMVNSFKQHLSSAKMDAATLKSAINAEKDWIESYANPKQTTKPESAPSAPMPVGVPQVGGSFGGGKVLKVEKVQ